MNYKKLLVPVTAFMLGLPLCAQQITGPRYFTDYDMPTTHQYNTVGSTAQPAAPKSQKKDNKKKKEAKPAQPTKYQAEQARKARQSSAGKQYNKELLAAVENNRVADVIKYIQLGADVNYTDAKDHSLLMIAAQKGNVEIADALVNVTIKVATAQKNPTVKGGVRNLSQEDLQYDEVKVKGANVNAKNKRGETALMFAGNEDMVDFLLKEKADTRAKDKDGATALHHAIAGKRVDVLDALLYSRKVDINAKNRNGETALMMAARLGQVDPVRYLLRERADIHAKNKNGYTPLMLALKSYVERSANTNRDELSLVVKALLEAGARADVKASDGITVCLLVARTENTELQDLFRKRNLCQAAAK